jgi:glycerol kinase
LWASTLDIADRIPVGEAVEPQRDEQWRNAAHEQWRAFVERAATM